MPKRRDDYLDRKKSIEKHELCIYRRQAKNIAKQFGYAQSIISKIEGAKTSNEISRIMCTARKAQSD